MADCHLLYKDVEGTSTQWDDIQCRLGNLPPKPEPFKPPPFAPWLDPDGQPREAARFGSVRPIAGSDFVREVSQAPSDVRVVVFLYEGGIPECGLLQPCLEELPTRYPETKFVKIISTECIPNYPDRNVPTMLVYNNGSVKGTFVGLQMFGGRKCMPESVALTLCQSDRVLNDVQANSDSSRNNVIEGVCKKFIEKVVSQHEEREEYDSD